MRETAVADELTPEEGERVRAVLRFLRKRHGRWADLAVLMGMKMKTLQQAAKRRTRRPTAGLALRAARVAGVCPEAILSGGWPEAGTCPHCGRR